MTAAPRHGRPPVQPELPLVEVPADDDGRPGFPEWRLDEKTREIGRRGVALARARLRRPGADRAQRTSATAGPHRRGGRRAA